MGTRERGQRARTTTVDRYMARIDKIREHLTPEQDLAFVERLEKGRAFFRQIDQQS